MKKYTLTATTTILQVGSTATTTVLLLCGACVLWSNGVELATDYVRVLLHSTTDNMWLMTLVLLFDVHGPVLPLPRYRCYCDMVWGCRSEGSVRINGEGWECRWPA